MKKTIIVISLITIITITIIATLSTNQYSLNAQVTEKDNNIITFEDTTGNLWEYEDNEGEYSIGDTVQLTWNDKGTEMKQDDEIVKVVAH